MKVKVAQCWDDGVATDIRLVELLRKYKAKATFNLCPGAMPENKRIQPYYVPAEYKGWSFRGFIGGKIALSEMCDIYDGFEVASHCWFHQVAGKVSDEDFTIAAYDARKFLEDSFQREFRGLAYPCGAFTPGAEQMLRDAGFAYARTVNCTDNIYSCTNTMEFHPNGKFDDPLFWEKFKKAKENGAFYFWGHSYEMMDKDELWDAFEEKLAILSADSDVEWVNVVDLADEINSRLAN